MRSIKSVAAGVAMLVIVVAGCGGGGESDTAKVENAVTGYLTALAKGEGEEACSKLTGDEEQSFVAQLVKERPGSQITSCSDGVEKLSEHIGASERSQIEGVEVVSASVEGDHATVKVKGGTHAAELTKEGDDWYISGGLAP